MKRCYLFFSLIFALPNAFAKSTELFNPCTGKTIALEKALSDSSIYLNKEVTVNNTQAFLISYLNEENSRCYDQPYDLFFKQNGSYIYYPKPFKELAEVNIEAYAEQPTTLVLNMEYGNGQVNLEKYYLIVQKDHIYLAEKEIVYSRSGSPKSVMFNKLSLDNVDFSKLINTD